MSVPPSPPFATQIDAAFPAAEGDLVSVGASFLASAAEQESLREAFAAQGATKRIVALFSAAADADVRADLLKTLAYLSLSDVTVPALFESLPLFLSLLLTPHDTVEPLLHATMCVGNIARQGTTQSLAHPALVCVCVSHVCRGPLPGDSEGWRRRGTARPPQGGR